jgi:uncharacterized protein (TIRG00374 family)
LIFKDILPLTTDHPSRNRILFWISILLAGIFLYLALRGLDWNAFTAALHNANYLYVLIIFIWGSLSSWFRANRWRVLLSGEKQIPTVKVFWANMAGYLANNVLPARAGELIRAIYLGKENDISTSFALATGLVERIMDLITLVILGSISLTLSGIVSAQLQDALRLMTVIAIIGLGGILSAPYIGEKILAWISPLPSTKPSVTEKIEGFLKQFLRGVEALHHPSRTGTFILFTCLIWIMDGIGMVILARSLHLYLTITQSFLLLAGLGLSSAIPSTPGYLGVYQFVAVIVLQPFGITNANALALIIFLQVINFLAVTFWGWISISRASVFLGKKRDGVS